MSRFGVLPRIDAVIFDWSGVISDDLEVVYAVTVKVFERIGRKFMPFDEFRERFDLPYMDFYKSLGVTKRKEELDNIYKELFLKHQTKVKPFSFARKTLKWLKEKNIKLAVFSSHPEDFLLKEIEDYGLSGIFSHVRGSIHDKREFIDEIVKIMGTGRNNTLFVGDMAHDILTGNTAGIMTAAVLSGYHDKERLKNENPNFILKDISDLRFIFDERFF